MWRCFSWIAFYSQHKNKITLRCKVSKKIFHLLNYTKTYWIYIYIGKRRKSYVHNLKHIRTHFKTCIKGRITWAPKEKRLQERVRQGESDRELDSRGGSYKKLTAAEPMNNNYCYYYYGNVGAVRVVINKRFPTNSSPLYHNGLRSPAGPFVWDINRWT